jgi:hypothetical protein
LLLTLNSPRSYILIETFEKIASRFCSLCNKRFMRDNLLTKSVDDLEPYRREQYRSENCHTIGESNLLGV